MIQNFHLLHQVLGLELHAITNRGFKEEEAEQVVDLMCDGIENRNYQASLD
jgi:Glycine/serine hydroxymethyltransferase